MYSPYKANFYKGLILSILPFLTLLCLAGRASAQPEGFYMQKNPDIIWVVVAACMVFFMQVGFTAFEAGSVQAKNAINISMKNLVVFVVSSLAYFLAGFALMFGNDKLGLVGVNHFYFKDVDVIPLGYAFAFFQVVFAGTSATIITGAMAERTRMSAHIWNTVLMMCVIYPIYGHWVWGHLCHHDRMGWLGRMGFIDFAGSTVVHSIGGWAALAGALVVGPRIGKYNKDGTVNRMGSHNIPLATIGAFFLWFGWFGFNGGSMLKVDAKIALVISNTNIAAGAAGCSSMLFSWLRNRRLVGEDVILGVLGGLVAVTAGSNRLEPWSAGVVGVVAGVLVLLAKDLFEKVLKIDDPVGAVSVHGVCGAVGTIALALLCPVSTLNTHNRLLQVGVQFLGVTVAFAWAFGLSMFFFWVGNKVLRLRVSREEELRGLNLHEYEDAASWLNFARINRLQDLNVLLEQKVEERTSELQKAKNYTQAIVDSLQDFLVVTDPQGKVLTLNPSAEGLLGYKKQEIVGKPLSLLLAEEGSVLKNRFQELLRGGFVKGFDSYYLTKEGQKVPVNFNGSVMRDETGGVTGLVTIARDMRETARLIAELQEARKGLELKVKDRTKELEEQKRKFEDVVNTLYDGLVVLEGDYCIAYWNRKMEEVSGVSRQEVLGKNILEVYPQVMEQELKGLLSTAMASGLSSAENVPYSTLRGREGYTSSRFFPLRDGNGDILGMVGVIADTTERKRLESEKEIVYNINKVVSSSFLTDIFKAISSELKNVINFDRISIALAGEDGHNFEIFALSADYKDTEIMEGGIYLKSGSLLERVYTTGRPYIVEDTNRKEFWSDEALAKEGIRSRLGYPLEYKGSIVGTINFASKRPGNFSEKHYRILEQVAPQLAIAIENIRLFVKVRESEKKYKDLYDNAPDIYLTHDGQGIILDCNRSGVEMLGYDSKEELVGRPIFEFQPPEFRETYTSMLPRRFSGLRIEGLELQLLKKDGSVIDVSLNDNPIYDDKGNVVAIRCVYRDITTKKRLEEQLISMEKLASTGRLVASVAHEVNNPLAGIINYLHLLSEETEEDNKRKYLELAIKGCNRIAGIVKRLLESHQQVFEGKTPHDVNISIRNVVNFLESRLRLSNINLVQELDANLPPVYCDPYQLEQVFTNLIVNASDAMPEGGDLKIKTGIRKEWVKIDFSDTGYGIPEKDLGKIFEPFFSTKGGAGTGLGLWVSYNIIKAHKGTIEIKSKEGKGTTVSIQLPIPTALERDLLNAKDTE
jgi:Amt family ammonium transporter